MSRIAREPTDDLLRFLEDASEASPASTRPWKLLVVDDDPEVHRVTRLALRGFSFGGRGLQFIGASSAAEARALLAEHPDVALMLLDMVMETEHAGLDVVRYVRDQLHMAAVRIVLRTGQPGDPPAPEIVASYDINDYKEKTELTFGKLFTLVHSSLRSYRDISTLERLNRTLEERVEERTRQLVRERDRAEAATRAKSEFLAAMSHEIRTQMHGVIGMTQLLAGTRLDAEQRDYASSVDASALALLDITNGILDFSKVEAGRMELGTAVFDVRDCVEEVAENIAPQASEKGLEVVFGVDRDVPARILADRSRLRQVLMNLAVNALKFTARGEIALHVALDRDAQAAPAGEVRLRCAVADTGIGIGREQQARLFEQYGQASAGIARTYGGTGLGLAICRGIVELMGGVIGVESEEGKGARFWFTIRAEVAEPVEPVEPIGEASAAPVRVVVVEPSVRVGATLVEQLEAGGASVRWVPSVAEALGADLALRGALVLVRYGAALEAGRHAVDALAQRGALGLVLLSARSRAEQRSRGTVGSFDAHVTYPLRRAKVAELLAHGRRGSGGVSGKAQGLATAPPADGDRSIDLASEPGTPEHQGTGGAVRTGPAPASAGEVHPSGAPAPAAGPALAPEAAAAPAAYQPSAYTILVAEDNPINAKLTEVMLDHAGYRCEVVRDGEAAVRAASSGGFDLVLMDCSMPLLDGFGATQAIRASTGPARAVPIVALTAGVTNDERRRCLGVGMDDYLTKPVLKAALYEKLEKLLRDARPRSA